jgi:hypothetical protein
MLNRGVQELKKHFVDYMTLVQAPDMEHIGKIVKRVVGRMIRLRIYETLKMMKIGWVFWWVGN